MADWCRYCEGDSSPFYCKVDGQQISDEFVKEHCMVAWGYGCSNSYIATAVKYVLNNDGDAKNKVEIDKKLANIRVLRTRLENDESYANYVEMYDKIGDVLAEKVSSDEEKAKLAGKLYSIMDRVSTFVEEGKTDRATLYYSKMVISLVNRYDISKLYNAEADFINRKNPEAKKVQKLVKTIEK